MIRVKRMFGFIEQRHEVLPYSIFSFFNLIFLNYYNNNFSTA